MIEIINLNKGYSNNLLIKNESLEISDKGITIINGESGIGKTTLVNCILQLDESYTGNIAIDGLYKKRDKKNYRKNNIGIVLQCNDLIEEETIKYNLELALKIAGKNIDDKKIDYCLEMVNLKNYKNRTIESLSGGQKQRVSIAKALIISPKYLFLDEPTSNLDYENSILIFSILKSISKNVGVVVISHDERVYEKFANYYITIKKGGIVSKIENELNDDIILKVKKNDVFTFPNGIIEVDEKFTENIKIYLRNNKIYIDSSLEIIKGVPIEENEEIQKVDKIEFDIDDFNNNKKVRFKKVYINILLFLEIALFSIISVIMFSVYNDESYVEYNFSNDNVYVIESNIHKNKKDIDTIRGLNDVFLLPYSHEMFFEMESNYLMQTNIRNDRSISFDCTPFPYNNENILYGREPKDKNEAVIDIKLIDKLKNRNEAIYLYGNYDYKSFVGTTISNNNIDLDINVVGVTNTNVASIYMFKEKINEICLAIELNAYNYYVMDNLNDNDIILSKAEYDNLNDSKQIVIDDINYNVAGYDEKLSDGDYFVSNNALENIIDNKIISKNILLRCYSSDDESIAKNFNNWYKLINIEKSNYENDNKSSIVITKLISVLFVLIAIIISYNSIKLLFIQYKNHINYSKILGYNKFFKDITLMGIIICLITIPFSIIGLFLINLFLNKFGMKAICIDFSFNLIMKLSLITIMIVFISLILLYRKYFTKKEINIINEMK